MSVDLATDDFPEPAERLARPGSLVLGLLGDLDRAHVQEVRLKAFVALGELLGISAPTMRVTLNRLRERGWFDVRRDGRESIYRLTSQCLRALQSGKRKLFATTSEPWDGAWSMVVYTMSEADRQARDDLRKRLVWLGFGPLAPTTWVCPYPRLEELADAASSLRGARLTLLTTRTAGSAEDRAIAAACWDLPPLQDRYARFEREVRLRLADGWLTGLPPEAAFAERIQLVHRFRRLVQDDPQLPPELQPAGWSGEIAHRLFVRVHDQLWTDAVRLYDSLGAAPQFA